MKTQPNIGLFRPITREEEKTFRVWARDNFKPDEMEVSDVWHPATQSECYKMLAERERSPILERWYTCKQIQAQCELELINL